MRLIRLFLILSLLLLFIPACKEAHHTEDLHKEETHGEDGHKEEGHIHGQASKFVTLEKEIKESIGLKTKKIESSSVPSYMETIGEVIANSNLLVNITPVTGGKVKLIRVNLGDYVHKGDLLSIISSSDLVRAIADLQGGAQKVKIASENLRIKKELAKTGAFSGPPYETKKEELLERKTKFITARENVKAAEANFKAASAEFNRITAMEETGEFGKKPFDEAKMNFAEAESEYVRAKSILTKSEEELKRSENLYKAGIISKKELLSIQTEYENAFASVTQTKTRMDIARNIMEREESFYDKGVRDYAELQSVKAKYAEAEKEYRQALSEFQKAKTDLDIKEHQMKREETIYSNDLNSAYELQQAESSYREAQIEYDRATSVLATFGITPENAGKYTDGELPVFSPINGYILERNINTGEFIYTNTIIFKVLDSSNLWIDSEIYEKDFTKIKMGQTVNITTSAYPDEIFTGKIFYISNTFHQETRTFDIRFSFDNRKNLLKPGMTVNSRIKTDDTPGLILPSSSVLDDEGKKIIFIAVNENTYERREVEAELLRNKEYVIKKGLSPGEEVVIEGAFELRSAVSSEALKGGCQH
ncbi:MAG TPA: efflux RND transporter periplasmic adaptor subunit [Candidatus Eremiobacteraeota bacterium]|nr:MAG: Cobalt-zinc-cadmium resistance protein CzcB [bacterium ADurb.Bin363]HPZ07229.1 efflux RND transporter periplasmic adaptor subunit [Candidatus Eremiobacteraeota bacterium]